MGFAGCFAFTANPSLCSSLQTAANEIRNENSFSTACTFLCAKSPFRVTDIIFSANLSAENQTFNARHRAEVRHGSERTNKTLENWSANAGYSYGCRRADEKNTSCRSPSCLRDF